MILRVKRMDDKVKIVAVLTDDDLKNELMTVLPEFVECTIAKTTKSAFDAIVGATGDPVDLADLVILNADDKDEVSLKTLRMISGNGNRKISEIPVILITEDEFSDNTLDFLECRDVCIYAGEIGSDDFYFMIMGEIEKEEMSPEETAHPVLYSEEKNPERIYGLSIHPEGETEDSVKRCMVLSDEEQIEHLEIAADRGKKKQEYLKDLIDATARSNNSGMPKEKPATGAPLHNIDRKKASEFLYADEEEEFLKKTERTIVIVDYDNISLNYCVQMLKRHYNVVPVKSGMNAIDYFVHNTADLLIINYSMPGIDGVKILENIRWQPNGRTVPAIFMLEMKDYYAVDRCRKEYVMGILQKPLSATVLEQAVKSVLKFNP